MVKVSHVTCGECGDQTVFAVCEWPPTFFWCRYCHSVFAFVEEDSEEGVTWQLRGF